MEIVAIGLALLFIVLIALLLFFAAIKIVNQYERILIFTLGGPAPTKSRVRAGSSWCRSCSARSGRPAREVHRGAEPDQHHQGQRPDQHRLPDLLADRAAVHERRGGRRLQRRPAEHRNHHPSVQ